MGGAEAHPGGDFFAILGFLVELIVSQIDDGFNAGVDHLGDEDQSDDKKNDRQFGGRNLKINTGGNGQNGKDQVNLEVGLGSESIDDAVEGVFYRNCVLAES